MTAAHEPPNEEVPGQLEQPTPSEEERHASPSSLPPPPPPLTTAEVADPTPEQLKSRRLFRGALAASIVLVLLVPLSVFIPLVPVFIVLPLSLVAIVVTVLMAGRSGMSGKKQALTGVSLLLTLLLVSLVAVLIFGALVLFFLLSVLSQV